MRINANLMQCNLKLIIMLAAATSNSNFNPQGGAELRAKDLKNGRIYWDVQEFHEISRRCRARPDAQNAPACRTCSRLVIQSSTVCRLPTKLIS